MLTTDAEPATPATRQRLLQAAITVFARQGYHGTTVDAIVAEAGTSKGAFYFYFPGKEALFLSLVENFAVSLVEDVHRAVRSASGAQARVEAALGAGMTSFARHPDLARVFLIESVGVNPAFSAKRHELHGRFAQLIASYLDEAVRDGAIPPIDTRLAGLAWLGAINEVVIDWLQQEPQTRPPLQALVPGLAGFLLRGSGWRLESRT